MLGLSGCSDQNPSRLSKEQKFHQCALGRGHLCELHTGALITHVLSLQGKLLYCHPPPGRDPVIFQYQHQRLLEKKVNGGEIKLQVVRNKKVYQIENVVDKAFFHQVSFKFFFLTSDPIHFIETALFSNSFIEMSFAYH